MKNGPPRRTAFPSALLIVLLLAGCGAGGDDPVVFGLAGPFETAYGASMRRGAELAQAEINASGGIRGRPLELRALDDGADPQRAIAVADELYRDAAVVAVVGHVNSGTTTAAAAVYAQGLPAVATSATSPEVSRLGEWIFRVASSDSANAVELARLARTLAPRTGILYANDDFGRGLAEAFRDAYTGAGGQVETTDPYLESSRDFTPYLQRLQRKGVELVFIAGIEDGASRIISQARELGMATRFIGGDGLEGLLRMDGRYEGTYVGLLYHPDASPTASSFAERFRAAYQQDPDSFAALGYDATRLVARAAADGGASRAGIRRQLEGVGGEGGAAAFVGATGTIRFDANGDPTGKQFAVGVIRAGKILLNDRR